MSNLEQAKQLMDSMHDELIALADAESATVAYRPEGGAGPHVGIAFRYHDDDLGNVDATVVAFSDRIADGGVTAEWLRVQAGEMKSHTLMAIQTCKDKLMYKKGSE